MSELEIKDFSFSLEPKRFRVNDDIFECAPEIPLHALALAANLKIDVNLLKEDPEKALVPIFEFFEEIMLGDSYQRFYVRFKDNQKPIGIRHLMKIVPWLVEEYGVTPTPQPSNSLNSPEDTGETSTAGVLSTESIPSTQS